jgi:hypothetical protein
LGGLADLADGWIEGVGWIVSRGLEAWGNRIVGAALVVIGPKRLGVSGAIELADLHLLPAALAGVKVR